MENLSFFSVSISKVATVNYKILYVVVVLFFDAKYYLLRFYTPKFKVLSRATHHKNVRPTLACGRVEWKRRNVSQFCAGLLLDGVFAKLFRQYAIMHFV